MEIKISVLLLVKTQFGTVRTTVVFLILNLIVTHEGGALVNDRV